MSVIVQPISELNKDKQLIINQILDVEAAVWTNPEWRVTRESLVKRINTFEDGFVVVLLDGKVVAFSSSMITTYPKHNDNWFIITDSGLLGNHNPESDIIWIVSMTVHPQYQSLGLGAKMLDFHWKNAQLRNKKLMVGTTPSGYAAYQSTTGNTIDEYLNETVDSFSIDKKVRFYQRNGFVIVDICSDYMPDPESEKWGCIMQK